MSEYPYEDKIHSDDRVNCKTVYTSDGIKIGQVEAAFADSTINYHDSIFPIHGAITPQAIIHFALGIEKEHYEYYKGVLMQNNVKIEKELKLDRRLMAIFKSKIYLI